MFKVNKLKQIMQFLYTYKRILFGLITFTKILFLLKTHIPNFITCLNLFCGCFAVIAMLNDFYFLASILIIIAAILDFLDGFLARLLNAYSEIGKQLDSLADMVSFGLVPGVILYKAIGKAIDVDSFNDQMDQMLFLPFLGLLISVFSAIRLAKFNIDTRQTTSFIGLPTPANTLFFITIPLIWTFSAPDSFPYLISQNSYVLITLTLVFSYLLIAEIDLISLKFKDFSWSNNKEKFILIFCSIALILWITFLAIPFIIILYLVLSLIKKYL
jgi:CDP-diacylglycerol--serine O-phosphatidyltransferase